MALLSSDRVEAITATAMLLALACNPGAGAEEGESDTDDSATTSGPTTSGPTTSGSPSSTTVDPSESSLDGPTESATEGTPCGLPPVDEAILPELGIYSDLANPGQIPVGSMAQAYLGYPDITKAPPPIIAIEACVEWSVEAVDGVSIDGAGLLSVADSVPAGTIFTVTADVENGRSILTADFTVYAPVAYDILGFWTEIQQLPCDGSPAIVPDPIIGELVFENTGEFSVTWTPFEVYYDYWGTFTYDEGTGALMLTVDGGNYIPDDIDGEGIATVMGGQLTLEDMWLGVAQNPVTPVACGHVFE